MDTNNDDHGQNHRQTQKEIDRESNNQKKIINTKIKFEWKANSEIDKTRE